jgi:integrase
LVKFKKLKTPKKLPYIMAKKERKAILDYAKKKNPDLYRIITFALYTGCRREEIKNARWQHYNDNWLTVTGKGNKQRDLWIIPEALEVMGPVKDIGPMFPQWHLRTYTKRVRDTVDAVGASEKIHFHSLRHAAATAMLEAGIPLEVVQKILGHASIKTTQIYAQVRNDLVKSQMAKFSYDG